MSVHALCRQVTDAEEEAAKKADERAKVWKTHNGSNSTSPNTTPSTSVEIVPKDSQAGSTEQPASSSKAERSHSADGESRTLSSIQSLICLVAGRLSFIHRPPHSCAHSLTHSRLLAHKLLQRNPVAVPQWLLLVAVKLTLSTFCYVSSCLLGICCVYVSCQVEPERCEMQVMYHMMW